MSRKPSTKVKAAVKLCAAMPATVHQLMAATGLARTTVDTHLGLLMSSRRICIKDWTVAPSGHALAIYAADADAPDAVKAVKPNLTFCATSAMKKQDRSFPLAGVWS